MKRKSANTTNKIYPVISILALLLIWQTLNSLNIVPNFMLPSPAQTVQAFIGDFGLLMSHLKVTLLETVLGTVMGVVIGFASAVLMDRWEWAYKAVYPIVVLTQTIPAVAIAPLLVLWFGYKMMPKIVPIVLITFFPIVVGVLDGFRSADKDAINLMRSMGATRWQIFRHIKFPHALPNFFSGLRITVAYSVVGAVLAEWLGGFEGLGVYMTRVKKAYAFDKMFAVIAFISIVSILLMGIVSLIERVSMPWLFKNKNKKEN